MKYSASIVGELFGNLPPSLPPKRDLCTLENYRVSVRERYCGDCEQDALVNWETFEEHREELKAWVAHYKRDAWLAVGHKMHNPNGTLTGMAWLAAQKLAGNDGSLGPLIDFEEHFQSCFLRRGLMIYLTLLIKEMET